MGVGAFLRLGLTSAVLSMLAGLVTIGAQAPPPARGVRGVATSSGTMPTSASVMTTYLIRNPGANETLELLILWRGSPGWFAKGGGSGSSGGGSGNTWRHSFRDGGHEFDVSYDFASRIATVQGQDVRLRDANVILVDRADSSEGIQIVGTIKVDGTLEDAGGNRSPVRVLRVMGRSKEIRDFLRCDTPLPDPRMQASLASLCAPVMAP